ncbi:MAG: DUF883 family protein [Maritimibacter sp.]|nr:DUF883 family protein [Maritimibacter sp.]
MAQANQTTPNTDDLMKEVAALRADFASLTKELGTLARAEKEALTAKAADRVVALKAQGERRLEEANELATRAAEEAAGIVRTHPAASIAAASAIGFIIGSLTARR